MSRRQFGGKVTKALSARYAQSPQWNGSKFLNLEETSTSGSYQDLPGFFRKQLCDKVDREPMSPLPLLPFDSVEFLRPCGGWKAVWFGHSVVLLRLDGKTVLLDPMFGPNAAPISPVAVRRYSVDTLAIIDLLPEIDLVLLTHDHYDHLDFESIQRLRSKVRQYVVPLGVGKHLVSWGIEESSITECDWWDRVSVGGLRVNFTPSRHFSGRGLTDRAKSLWGGWVLSTGETNLWFSGDGGYGTHFKTIGEKLGPFDFGFMECGQYNEMWHALHMYPEESVRAALDASARVVMPIHWGAFTLAQHTWREPVERFLAEAFKQELPCLVPRLGELIRWPGEVGELNPWWRES